MTTQLMRNSNSNRLRRLYKKAAQDAHAHPGLLLQRGLTEHDEKTKTDHIESVCRGTAGEFYKRTYKRWKQATADRKRFRRVFLKLETRLFIGLTGGGMLETGCAISHSHGMPYIPGSSVKGVVNAYAHDRLDKGGADICDELFGSRPTKQRPEGLSGADFLSRRLVGSQFGLLSIGTRGRNLSPSRLLRQGRYKAGHRLRQSGSKCPSRGTGASFCLCSKGRSLGWI